MIAIILRIVMAILAAGFIGWWLYITWLGLKVFFGLPIDIACKTPQLDNIATKKDED